MATATRRTRRTAFAGAATVAAAASAALAAAHGVAAAVHANHLDQVRPCYYETYIVTGRTVTLRSAPGSSNILKTLREGDEVVYYHSVGGGGAWHYVGHNGTDGWILSQYVRFYRSGSRCG